MKIENFLVESFKGLRSFWKIEDNDYLSEWTVAHPKTHERTPGSFLFLFVSSFFMFCVVRTERWKSGGLF